MSQINFSLIFAFTLGVVLFSMENNTPTEIKLFKKVSFSLPLPILLIISGGIGAMLAWAFSAWNGMDNTSLFNG